MGYLSDAKITFKITPEDWGKVQGNQNGILVVGTLEVRSLTQVCLTITYSDRIDGWLQLESIDFSRITSLHPPQLGQESKIDGSPSIERHEVKRGTWNHSLLQHHLNEVLTLLRHPDLQLPRNLLSRVDTMVNSWYQSALSALTEYELYCKAITATYLTSTNQISLSDSMDRMRNKFILDISGLISYCHERHMVTGSMIKLMFTIIDKANRRCSIEHYIEIYLHHVGDFAKLLKECQVSTLLCPLDNLKRRGLSGCLNLSHFISPMIFRNQRSVKRRLEDVLAQKSKHAEFISSFRVEYCDCIVLISAKVNLIRALLKFRSCERNQLPDDPLTTFSLEELSTVLDSMSSTASKHYQLYYRTQVGFRHEEIFESFTNKHYDFKLDSKLNDEYIFRVKTTDFPLDFRV